MFRLLRLQQRHNKVSVFIHILEEQYLLPFAISNNNAFRIISH